VIVTETLENLKSNKNFLVRPKYIKNASDWLIRQNDLYRGVVVISREEEEYDLNHVFISSAHKHDLSAQNISSNTRSATSSKSHI